MRNRRAVTSARRELQVGAAARDLQEHAVVAVVSPEAADFPKTEPITVEAHDLVEALGMTGDTELCRARR